MKFKDISDKSPCLISTEEHPYCVSSWDEYRQDGYAYFPTQEKAEEYAESIKSKVESISIDIIDNDGSYCKNISKWHK